MIRLLTFLIVALCIALAGEAQSTDSLSLGAADSVMMRWLDNVVVYGHKPYAEVIPAQTLTGEHLEALAQHSVADAIRFFSGVQIKDYGGVGGIKTIDIRSMGTNHLGVFYDGIQLGNAQNGQIDLGKFSLDNIEEISLFNGQKSEIFQSARDFGSAGTVYLKTKRPTFKGLKRDNFNVTFRTGSFGLANPSVRWEHKMSNSVSTVLSAEYTYANGQYHFRYRKRFSDGTVAWDTTAVRHNGDVNALRVEAAVFGYTERGKWNTKLYFYNSERGIPGAIVNNVWLNSQRQWDRNFFAQGSWQKKVSEHYETMVGAKYAHDYMRYLNPDTTLLLIDNKFWQDEIYVTSANKLTLAHNWDADLSVDYQWNYLNASLINFVYPQRHTLLTALATAYTLQGFKAQASMLYTLVNDRYSTHSGISGEPRTHFTNTFNKFTPAVFLSYRPWAKYDLSFRAFFKKIFRMPTFNDLYYTDIGNAHLKPEYAHQYNVGVHYQFYKPEGLFRGLRVTADGYYNRITDKIIAVPSGRGQYRWMMMNIGKVKIRGLDLTARTTFGYDEVNVDVSLNYTYQKAQDYSDPSDNGDAGSYKGQISYVPWHNGSATVHAAWRALDVNYSFIYVGERYHNSSNIRANHEQPWYTSDLSASYVFDLGATQLKVTAEVNNLLNQYYDVIQHYPMPGRNYKLILKFDF